MLPTLPLPLPAEVVDTYAIDLAAPYTAGWGYQHLDAAYGPGGDLYVLSGLGRYKPGGEAAENPHDRTVALSLLARYAADGGGEPASMAVVRRRTRWSKFGDAWDFRLAVLPDGTVALCGRHDNTYLFDAELTREIGAYTQNSHRRAYEDYEPGTPFASRIAVTPGGRLLCVTAEYGTNQYGNFSANLIGIADTAPTAGERPAIHAFASLDARPKHQLPELDVSSYVMHEGRPVGLEHRPEPALGDLVAEEWAGLYQRRRKWLGTPRPLADDRFVIPVFAELFRSGNRGNAFTFALVDDKGAVLGKLRGMHAYQDSPYTGGCYQVATDPARGRVYHLNRYGLYAWDADGELLAKVSTGIKPFSLLKNFSLLGCSPDGDLVLAQDKQHLLARVPVPADDLAGGLGTAVETGLAAFGKHRTALKKQWAQEAWHWTYRPEAGRLHEL
ncbi:hypothetical protein GCM10023205_32470 [Yinghuangia aomiensis]|uniref:Uncharacterized protein n=1 Tax=Yinghuangia aomiensis TaxID=676205 RepID=A0ABP9HAE4_9ACTN